MKVIGIHLDSDCVQSYTEHEIVGTFNEDYIKGLIKCDGDDPEHYLIFQDFSSENHKVFCSVPKNPDTLYWINSTWIYNEQP